jgi:hypothetical protein
MIKRIEYKKKYGSIKEYLEYCELVEKVRKIDESAAEILSEPSFKKFTMFSYGGDIRGCFVWKSSIKGDEYWRGLHCMINSSSYNRVREVVDSDYELIDWDAGREDFWQYASGIDVGLTREESDMIYNEFR